MATKEIVQKSLQEKWAKNKGRELGQHLQMYSVN